MRVMIVFVVLGIIGWIINLINSQNHPPPPNRRRRETGERAGKVQNEIEQFLDEARRARQARQGGAPADDGIEIVEPGRRPPPPQQKSREEVWREQTQQRRNQREAEDVVVRQQSKREKQRKPQKPASAPASAQKPAPAAQPSRAGHTASATATANSGQRMNERIAQETQSHLPHAVNKDVQAHLGAFTAESEAAVGQQGYRLTKTHQSKAVRDLRQLLKSSSGARSAIILSEILKPPLSRRK